MNFDLSKTLNDFWGTEDPECTSRQININPQNTIEEYRWETLLTKEPETIEWIRRMNKSSILLDVGANIGVYTLSALAHGVKHVIAFEPSPLSFSRLVSTLQTNQIFEHASCFCCALSNQPDVIYFSHHLQNQSGLAEFSQTKTDQAKGGFPVVCEPLDIFEESTCFKNVTHMKIDVDGPEIEVLQGAAKLLNNPSLVSILIECTEGQTDQRAVELLAHFDFKIDTYYNQLPDHSINRRIKEGINARNLVFTR